MRIKKLSVNPSEITYERITNKGVRLIKYNALCMCYSDIVIERSEWKFINADYKIVAYKY